MNIKRWMDTEDICPFCKSDDINEISEHLDDEIRDATVLNYCSKCEGVFGYGT